MDLVACVGSDKENWGQITALMRHGQWENIILVMNKEVQGFPHQASIIVKNDQPLLVLKEELLGKLRTKLAGDFEVALSLASGNGKEHMALLAALLSLPVGVRIVVYTKEGVQFVT